MKINGTGSFAEPIALLKRVLLLLRRHGPESWSRSWPMIVIMALQFSMNITDVYVAGILGSEMQATVGFVTQLYFLLILFGNAMTVGTVAMATRLFGADDIERLRAVSTTLLKGFLLAGVVLGATGFFFTPLIIDLAGIPAELKEPGRKLLGIYSLGLPGNYLFIFLHALFRSTSRMKTSMMVMAAGAILNIGLTFGFVLHTPLGYPGIALSTVISVVTFSVASLLLARDFLEKGHPMEKEVLFRVFRIGWPSGLLQLSWHGGSMVIFLILASIPGEAVAVMAAFTNGLRIESAIFMPAFAISMGNAVITGTLLGGTRKDDAPAAGATTAIMGVLLISLLALVVVLAAPFLASLLSDNRKVIERSVEYLYISMISEPFMAWAAILSGGLNGAGDTRPVLASVLIAIWGIRIPLCFLFGVILTLDVTFIWWSMNLSMAVHALLISRRYFSRKWVT